MILQLFTYIILFLFTSASLCFPNQIAALKTLSINTNSNEALNQESEENRENSTKQKKNDENDKDKDDSPLFTGSLLSLATSPVKFGKILLIPKVWNFVRYGGYDKNCQFKRQKTIYSLNPVVTLLTGIAEDLDIGFTAQMFQNYYKRKIFTGFGDCSFQMKYRLLSETDESPAITVGIGELLPTGSYHHLDPEFEATDGVGNGSYITVMGIRFEKNFHVNDKNWLRFRYDVRYEIPSSVNINGTSVYNTGFRAKGTAYPGKVFTTDCSCEYHLTKNWVLACDLFYSHANLTHFKGYAGFKNNEEIKHAGRPSSDQITLAPAIEYNVSNTVGFIAGVWFTVWGRNTSAFYSPVISAILSY
jgi:hypothetical protein